MNMIIRSDQLRYTQNSKWPTKENGTASKLQVLYLSFHDTQGTEISKGIGFQGALAGRDQQALKLHLCTICKPPKILFSKKQIKALSILPQLRERERETEIMKERSRSAGVYNTSQAWMLLILRQIKSYLKTFFLLYFCNTAIMNSPIFNNSSICLW